jgi:coiled-coil domain-containing protein 55
MPLKFGFTASKKSPDSNGKKPTPKTGLGFEDAFDEEQASAAPLDGTKTKKPKPRIAQFGDLSSQKNFRKNIDKALKVDPSIYDYDAAYDAIQARVEAKKAAEREKAQSGESQYMKNLLVAKDVRDKDYLRARENKMKRERETEGDEFADKEKFVTGAYKKQQEELRRQEAEEEKKEEAERKRRENFGQRTFLNNMLNQGEQKHSEYVEAAMSKEFQKSIAEELDEKTEAEIAKDLNSKGANIEITDDGEIADKRQLLSAGLNVMARPKASGTSSGPKPNQSQQTSQFGRTSNQKLSRERQSRMMEAQFEQLLKRHADDESEELREKEHAAKTQKTTGDITSARERYLQRKKAAAEGKDAVT